MLDMQIPNFCFKHCLISLFYCYLQTFQMRGKRFVEKCPFYLDKVHSFQKNILLTLISANNHGYTEEGDTEYLINGQQKLQNFFFSKLFNTLRVVLTRGSIVFFKFLGTIEILLTFLNEFFNKNNFNGNEFLLIALFCHLFIKHF